MTESSNRKRGRAESLDGETKMPLTSMDLAEEKREQLKALFPEVFTEDKVDFEQLKRVLGEWVELGKERFGLNWPGKAECMKIIQQPSVATLKPTRDESVNFDETENLFIEGDNLEVLKLLQKSYFGKVKVIYIDPPYNTGKEFIYPDKYAETLDTYLAYTGQIDESGHKFSTNTEQQGRYHSNWLNMMYPRLYLAKNLLREDGVIFISIDDNEYENLKGLCSQVFGEENLAAELCVIRSEGGGLAKQVIKGHDYLLVYAKSLDNFVPLKRPKEIRGKIIEKDFKKFWLEEDWLRKKFGRYGTCHYEEILELKGEGKKQEIDQGIANGDYRLIKKRNGMHVVARLRPLDEDGSKFYSVIKHLNAKGNEELSELGIGDLFSFPKPISLVKDLVLGGTFHTKTNNDIILDFFAGSGTTAHAVMQLNKEDNGSRKFICVQLPEPTDETDEAYNAGYKTIADISKERIRRAAQKIEEEQNGQLDLNGSSQLDLGFKVFKLARSNFKIWEGGVEKITNLEQQLFEHIDHINAASTPEDILYELLLKAGFPLTASVEKITMAGKDVFLIEKGAMLICLDKELNQAVMDAMAKASPRQVICLDEGFKGNDQLKANAVQTFKVSAQGEESEILFRTV